MREAVYLILGLAIAGPAFGSESPPRSDSSLALRHSTAVRLDLRTPAVLPWSAAPRRSGTGSYGILKGLETSASLSAGSPTGGALAWALPAGLSLLASGLFGQTVLTGQAAWPLGATVPSLKTSAAITLDLDGIVGSPLRLNMSVNRNWQLDGPIGGTFPDCALRLDIAAEAAPKVSFQTPCGVAGHFGFGIHSSF